MGIKVPLLKKQFPLHPIIAVFPLFNTSLKHASPNAKKACGNGQILERAFHFALDIKFFNSFARIMGLSSYTGVWPIKIHAAVIVESIIKPV
jgi:hypothetical protein